MGKKIAYLISGIVTGIFMTLAIAKMIPYDEDNETFGYQGERLKP